MSYIEEALQRIKKNELKEGIIVDLYKFLKEKDVEISIINKILGVVKEKEMDQIIEEITNRIDPGNKEVFEAIKINVSKMNIALFDKIKFLNMLKSKNLLKSYEGKLIDLLENNELITKYHKSILNFVKNILDVRFKVRGKGNTSSGKGELFLALFGNGRIGDNGDVYLPKLGEVEVKSESGIIVPPGTFLYKVMDPEKELPDYEEKKNKTGFENYIKNISDKKLFQQILKKVFVDRVYPEYKSVVKKVFDNTLGKATSFSDYKNIFPEFVNELGEEIYKIYKQKEGFDYLWFTDGEKAVLINDNPSEKIVFNLHGFFSNGGNNKPTITMKSIK